MGGCQTRKVVHLWLAIMYHGWPDRLTCARLAGDIRCSGGGQLHFRAAVWNVSAEPLEDQQATPHISYGSSSEGEHANDPCCNPFNTHIDLAAYMHLQ